MSRVKRFICQLMVAVLLCSCLLTAASAYVYVYDYKRIEAEDGTYSIILSENMERINWLYFSGSQKLVDIRFSSSMRVIEKGAFRGCTKLSNVELNEGLTSIQGQVFMGCTSLTSIVIPESVVFIGYETFANCTGLQTVKLPSKLTEISGGLFLNCPTITSIEIPSSVTIIYGSAFEGTSLSSVVLPSSLTTLGESVFKNTPLASVTVPDTLEDIGWDAFSGTKISSFNFPEGLRIINSGAFQNTKLTSISLPETVTEIGGNAFAGCPLTEAYIYSRDAQIGKNAFPASENLTIYGYRLSTAAAYARENGIRFVALDDCSLSAEIKEDQIQHMDICCGSPANNGETFDYAFHVDVSVLPENDNYHDVVVTVTLPEGFTFDRSEYLTVADVELETAKGETKLHLPTIYPIYLDDAKAGKEYKLQIEISGCADTDNAARSDMTEAIFCVVDNAVNEVQTGADNLGNPTVGWSLEAAAGNGHSYSQEAAELSAVLSTLAYDQWKLADFLRGMGFRDFRSFEMDSVQDNTCGYHFATKRVVKDGQMQDLVLVICRGTPLQVTEWASNLNMGMSAEHEGFALAAADLQTRLTGYCQGLKQENTLFLVTGHSRGAAVANLTARWLGYESTIGKKENVTAYTFATPTVSAEITSEQIGKSGNENIFNFVNYQDAIRNAPSMKHYGRYGHVYIFGYAVPAAGAKEYSDGFNSYPALGSKQDNYTVNELVNALLYDFDPKSGDMASTAGKLVNMLRGCAKTTGRSVLFDFGKALFNAHDMPVYYNAVHNGIHSGASFAEVNARTEKALSKCEEMAKMGSESSIVRFFKCPINISVQDSSGTVVARIESGVAASESDEVIVLLMGNMKMVSVKAGAEKDYTIRIDGYDTGSMIHANVYYKNGGISAVELCRNIPVNSGTSLELSKDGYVQMQEKTEYLRYKDAKQIQKILSALEDPDTEENAMILSEEPKNSGGFAWLLALLGVAAAAVYIVIKKKKVRT